MRDRQGWYSLVRAPTTNVAKVQILASTPQLCGLSLFFGSLLALRGAKVSAFKLIFDYESLVFTRSVYKKYTAVLKSG